MSKRPAPQLETLGVEVRLPVAEKLDQAVPSQPLTAGAAEEVADGGAAAGDACAELGAGAEGVGAGLGALVVVADGVGDGAAIAGEGEARYQAATPAAASHVRERRS